MKQMIKLGLILALYTSIACVSLALVSNLTSGAIKAAAQKELNDGLRKVYPDADNFTLVEGDFTGTDSVQIDAVYKAEKDSSIIGAVVQATGSTYDKATMLVGIRSDKTITSIQFLSLTDTPGFGQKALEPAFKDQFNGKSANDEFAIGADVDAISGSTITTKGVITIIKNAVANGLKVIENGGTK
ncbi:MAG TPA: FMN-binding protein [Treponemataceae bacterium]|nr:FMN-binding protein [Treponemataceae bacterium]